MESKQVNTSTLAKNWNQGAKGFQKKKNPRRHRHSFFLNDEEQAYLDELFSEGYKKAEMIAEMLELHRQHKNKKKMIMTNSERTKLIAKAGEYVKAKTESKKNKIGSKGRDKFIREASIRYGVKLETLQLILG